MDMTLEEYNDFLLHLANQHYGSWRSISNYWLSNFIVGEVTSNPLDFSPFNPYIKHSTTRKQHG